MPFAIPDPSLPRPASAPDSLTPSMPDDAGAFRQQLDQFRSTIERAAIAEQDAAVAAVQGAPEVALLAGTGAALESLWARYDAAVAAIGRDANLSAAGRTELIARAATERNAARDRGPVRVLSQVGDTLLGKFPTRPMPMMPGELAAPATFILASAESMLPSRFAGDALDLLRTASDPGTPPEAGFAANVLLNAAYAPLLERFADAPPKHWSGWVGAAGKLAALIRMHIATTWQRARSEAAREAVSAFRGQFTWLDRSAIQLGRWDDTFRIGAPAFAWPSGMV